MENPLHAKRSPPSFRTIRTPTSCLLYQHNTLHTQGILLPSRTTKKENGPKQLQKTNISQHRQNTSWEPATVVSQSSSNSYWIMQENNTDQPRVYRRTRSMLKIRCTDVRRTRHNYSQLTEIEKAKFQTPFTYNDERNFVECNPVKKISNDLVHPTKSDTFSVSTSIFSEEREEIAEDIPAPADISAPAPAPALAPTLETVKEQPYTPGSRKSMRKNLGRPASTFSDFYM